MNAKTKLSAAVLALLASGAGALAIAERFIREEESGLAYPLQAYQDGARRWTVCDGKTAGVTADTRMTRAQCDQWRQTAVARRMAFVRAQLPAPMPPARLAALTSFCFNVGNAACARSTAFRLLQQGETQRGCKALLNWRYITRDGQKVDCSRAQPHCAGLWQRRQKEAALCLLEVGNG